MLSLKYYSINLGPRAFSAVKMAVERAEKPWTRLVGLGTRLH